MELNFNLPKPVLEHYDPINIYDYNDYVLNNQNIYLKLFQSLYILNICLFNKALHPNYDINNECITNKLSLFPIDAYLWSKELVKKKYTCRDLFTHLFLQDSSIEKKQQLLYQMILPFIKKQEKNKLMSTIDRELKLFHDDHDVFIKKDHKSPPNNFRENKNKKIAPLFSFMLPEIFN